MKKISLITLLLVLLLCLSACGTEGPEQVITTGSPAPDITEASAVTDPVEIPEEPLTVKIIENGEGKFTVIRPEKASNTATQSCVSFVKSITSKTDLKLTINDDWYKDGIKPLDPDALEILIGHTNRAATAEILESLPENSYAVSVRKDKVVIVGKDESLTALALRDFEKNILKDPEKCGKGFLTLSESDSFTVTLDEPLTLSKMIEMKLPVSAVSEKVAHTSKQGEYRVGQGSASDGTYVYFVLRNSSDSGSVITKHNLADGKLVAVSEVLDLGHGNDMTYDTKNKRLVVAHGQSEGQILTLVDPETLAFIKDINIPKGSGAITYNEKRDQYAISQGGKTLYILDSDFKLVSSFSRSDSTGYTAQGMGSDDDYIYFPMSGKDDNKLVVYDWNGKYVKTLTVPVDHESESMFWVNGKYYIAYNTNGEALYETEFVVVYQ